MFYTYQNVKVHYQIFGNSSKVILILPGWGETSSTFKQIISILAQEYTVYIFDYPGFGESPSLNTIWTIYDYASLFKSFLEDKNISPSLLIAHSFGGRLAIILNGYFHIAFPKILLMDSAGIRPKRTLRAFLKKQSYHFLKNISKILPRKLRKKFLSFIFKKFASPDYYQLPSSMRLTFQKIIEEDLQKYLSFMDSEVLLLWGQKDLDTPLRDAFIMKDKIKDSELIVVQDAKHFVYLNNSYLTIQIILAFLKEED